MRKTVLKDKVAPWWKLEDSGEMSTKCKGQEILIN
jgi:hypothetical protein